MEDRANYLVYEKTAEIYDRERFHGPAGQWGHNRQIEILKHLIGNCKNKKVLEIGCGTGRITEALARIGANVTATDISKEMLNVAKNRFNSIQGVTTPKFQLMSVFDIDIDLREYDIVVMINVLGRLTNPAAALQNIASRISRDCRFIFTFPCLTSILLPFGLIVNKRGKSLSRDVTSMWYSPAVITDFCRSASLEIIGFHGNHYVPVPRILFWTLPFFWLCDKIISQRFPKLCPSVFAECRLTAQN